MRGTDKSAVTFLGSGDFHQISHLLISQFDEPLSVITFDFHPDWDILPPRLHCGSWVTQTLRRPNILKFILMGVSSKDISTFRIQSGNLKSLRNNRVEIYPHSHGPSLAFFKKVPHNVSIHAQRGTAVSKVFWIEIKGKNLAEFFGEILGRLPTRNVYVSIDKDCLTNEYALTNWEEGRLSLDELLLMLGLIKKSCRIRGVDVVGDYSKMEVAGIFKRMLCSLDHPKNIKATTMSESLVTAVNETTNIKILEVLNS